VLVISEGTLQVNQQQIKLKSAKQNSNWNPATINGIAHLP